MADDAYDFDAAGMGRVIRSTQWVERIAQFNDGGKAGFTPRFQASTELKLTGTLTHGGTLGLDPGVYAAHRLIPPLGSLTLTAGTLGLSNVGDDSNAFLAYYVNDAELGGSGHALAANTTSSATVVSGFSWSVAADGKQVFAGGGASGAVAQLLKPTGTLTIGGTVALCGGIYAARLWLNPTGSLTLTGSTYSNSLLGSDPGADNAYFVNLEEMGQSTHDLVSTASTATLALGINIGKAADGKPVYVGPMDFPGCS